MYKNTKKQKIMKEMREFLMLEQESLKFGQKKNLFLTKLRKKYPQVQLVTLMNYFAFSLRDIKKELKIK